MTSDGSLKDDKEDSLAVRRLQLSNGLRVICQPMHDAPVVALQAWVHVGSADEDEVLAGVAHLHEHMLFKGTEKRGVGEIARTVEASGGEINAWTSFDQTAYHVVLAADELEVGMDILADALRHSSFDPDELARETEVVVEEIKRAQDSPSRRVSNALFSLAYKKHPYRRPVLGSEATVRGMTRDAIMGFFKEHYRPTRVTLVAVGDFDVPHLESLVESHFGEWSGLEETGQPMQQRLEEPAQDAVRSEVLVEDVRQSRLAVAWHIPGVTHEDIPAIDALSIIMGHGESSRLYIETRRQQQLVNDVYAYAYTPQDPGLFMVGAGLRAENLQATLESLLQQVFETRHRLVAEEELERARTIILSEAAYQRDTVQGQARKIGFYEVVVGDVEAEERYREQLRALTVHDLRDVAQRYLSDTPCVVIQTDEQRPELSEKALSATIASTFEKIEATQKARPKPKGDGVLRVELDSGTVLLLRAERSPVVAIRAAAVGGLRQESRERQGIGALLAHQWGAATADLGPEAMAKRVAHLGGSLSAFSGRNALGMRGDFIAERALEGTRLLCDAMLRPGFTEVDLERERAVLLERIRARADNPAGVAFDAFLAAVFPTHPYGMRSIGTHDSMSALTFEQVSEHWSALVAPERFVVSVVGGIDIPAAIDILAEYFDAKSHAATPTAPAREAGRTERLRESIELDKKQAHVIVGGLGTTVDDPDRFALQTLNTVLSGQSGRLFMDLRDRQSLAYSVSSSNLEGLDPGHVMVHIGTSPEKVDAAIAGIMGHLQRVREEVVSEEELQRAKRYQVGTYAIDLQRCGARAMTMALSEVFGMAYDDYELYGERIQAVTAADLQRVANRYFVPDQQVEVVVGPKDAPGE